MMQLPFSHERHQMIRYHTGTEDFVVTILQYINFAKIKNIRKTEEEIKIYVIYF